MTNQYVRRDWSFSPHPPTSPLIQASVAHVTPIQGTCCPWAIFLTLTYLYGSQATILLGLAPCTFLSSLCLVWVLVTAGPWRKVSELSVGLRTTLPPFPGPNGINTFKKLFFWFIFRCPLRRSWSSQGSRSFPQGRALLKTRVHVLLLIAIDHIHFRYLSIEHKWCYL